MSEWVDVVNEASFAPGDRIVVDLEGDAVAVFNLDGEYYAIEDVCSHDGAEIASGLVEDDQIICPRHGARFCLRSGEVLSPPAYEDLHSFPLRVKDGMIQVRDDRWD